MLIIIISNYPGEWPQTAGNLELWKDWKFWKSEILKFWKFGDLKLLRIWNFESFEHFENLETTGDHSGRPRETTSIPLGRGILISKKKFHWRPRETTGDHVNTARARHFDLKEEIPLETTAGDHSGRPRQYRSGATFWSQRRNPTGDHGRPRETTSIPLGRAILILIPLFWSRKNP